MTAQVGRRDRSRRRPRPQHLDARPAGGQRDRPRNGALPRGGAGPDADRGALGRVGAGRALDGRHRSARARPSRRCSRTLAAALRRCSGHGAPDAPLRHSPCRPGGCCRRSTPTSSRGSAQPPGAQTLMVDPAHAPMVDGAALPVHTFEEARSGGPRVVVRRGRPRWCSSRRAASGRPRASS